MAWISSAITWSRFLVIISMGLLTRHQGLPMWSFHLAQTSQIKTTVCFNFVFLFTLYKVCILFSCFKQNKKSVILSGNWWNTCSLVFASIYNYNIGTLEGCLISPIWTKLKNSQKLKIPMMPQSTHREITPVKTAQHTRTTQRTKHFLLFLWITCRIIILYSRKGCLDGCW